MSVLSDVGISVSDSVLLVFLLFAFSKLLVDSFFISLFQREDFFGSFLSLLNLFPSLDVFLFEESNSVSQ